MVSRLKRWADAIKRDVLALYLAMRDPRIPWFVKALAALVASYALSPIDLIPDFIPVLGYLDDLILLPLGILLVVRLIPKPIVEELRRRAAGQLSENRPRSLGAAAVIVTIWVAAILALAILLLPDTVAG